MNTIIILMWVAGVTEKLHIVCILIALVSAFIAFVRTMKGDGFKPPIVIATVCLALFALLPSKTTVYGFIALHAGKEIVESKVGQKAYQALDSILDKVIQETGANKLK